MKQTISLCTILIQHVYNTRLYEIGKLFSEQNLYYYMTYTFTN